MSEIKNNPEVMTKNQLERFYVTVKDILTYLLSKWIIILIFGFGSAGIGLLCSFIIKPKYTAHLAFVLVEKGSAGGGLASLASNLGFVGLLGSGSDNAFSGDNLLEIIKSRYTIEKTLLTPINFEGKKISMADAYIQFTGMKKSWLKSEKKELQNLNFPFDQARNTFSRTQDSVLCDIYNDFIDNNNLIILRKNKRINMVNVYFTSKSEVFSKLFIENLINQTYEFYKNTRTAQSQLNIERMQHTADSVKNLYESALYGSARVSQVNINSAMQYAAVPRIKEEYNVQLYGAVYAEVLKNLETLKLDRARDTPIFQIIDKPIYPLKKEKFGKIKGIVYGGGLGGLIIVMFLLVSYEFKKLIK